MACIYLTRSISLLFLLSRCIFSLPLSLSHSVYPTTSKGSEWFESKVNIEVSQASRKAIETIEKVGGQITTAHYNALGLRVLLKPWRFDDRLKPRRALPNKKLMAYYLNPENRFEDSSCMVPFCFSIHSL